MSKTLTELPVQFLFRLIGEAAVAGDQRAKVSGPMGGRYMSTSTKGGPLEGPRIKGQMLQGFAWGPHRMAEGAGYGHMHYDVKVLLLTEDGYRILMRYRGTNSPAYADGSWRTGVVFEAEKGPYEWLNALQGIGIGRKLGDAVEYMIYAVTA
ncbi:DUF3237 family protein [Sphingobium tyrosinilyticum]|uniref:DUF3237 family protein n=1 Tax=Sphingobium tyrosinilyticum TaxID=2715436 RepID=A0ABV9F3Z3_9SPHN